jgi:hypothetical protein
MQLGNKFCSLILGFSVNERDNKVKKRTRYLRRNKSLNINVMEPY